MIFTIPARICFSHLPQTLQFPDVLCIFLYGQKEISSMKKKKKKKKLATDMISYQPAQYGKGYPMIKDIIVIDIVKETVATFSKMMRFFCTLDMLTIYSCTMKNGEQFTTCHTTTVS